MGKKRIVTTEDKGTGTKTLVSKGAKIRHALGILYIQSTYNNTKVMLADTQGNTLAWSSSGSLGFRGAKKGTPFAASKIGDLIADRASAIGIKEVRVVIKGVGSGRESALRSFISRGINLLSISDVTPVPHNGPRAPKPRRV